MNQKYQIITIIIHGETPTNPNNNENENNNTPPETNTTQPEIPSAYPEVTEPPLEENNNNNQLSSNAFLSSLQVNAEGISPRFNKNTTKYYLIIDNKIDTLKVTAVPEDSNARVNIDGNTNLQIGTNVITINVTAPNGTIKTYSINVTKTDDPNNANTNLENLAIEGVTLNPEFDVNVLEYSAFVGSDIETLKILAVPEIEGANVNVTGGDKLVFGNNIVSITVTAKDGKSVKVYSVNVYRRTEAEEKEIEEEKALLEENNINEETNNIDNTLTNEENIIRSNTKKGNKWLWILFWILIVIVMVLFIYIFKNKKTKH